MGSILQDKLLYTRSIRQAEPNEKQQIFRTKMKLLLAAIPFARADFSIMASNYDAMAQNASKQLRSGNRNVAPIPSFNQFQNYGCWCYFTGDGALQGSLHNRRGAGRPVDDMDSYCRDLQWGYDCLLMDADANGYIMADAIDDNNNGAPCVPWEVEYLPGTAGGYAAIETLCQTLNTLEDNINRECQIETCKIESLFTLNVLGLAGIANGIDPVYRHDQFNPTSDSCRVISGVGPDERECCGAFPYRRPFHTRNGVNECCTDGGAIVGIYQPLIQQCCTGGFIIPAGEICP